MDSNSVSGSELDRFIQRRVEELVSLRISPLQKALVDQSAIIKTLSQRAIEAEATLQRLASAVEQLCQRNEPATPEPQPDLYQQLPDSGFRPRIVKEGEEKQRHRKRLAGM